MAPVEIHAHAAENLRYIRETMERAAAFTAVPGWGGVAMGLTAVVACVFAADAASPGSWLTMWLGEAAVAFLIGLVAMRRKAVRTGFSLSSAPGRKFIVAFAPAVGAGAALTYAALNSGSTALLPPLWLSFYGVAILAAGTYSIPVVRAMGTAFLLLGGLGAVVPQWGNVLLGAGFGGLHIVFGSVIARRYGG